ncbi:MAG: SDR family NAD(P)-dependent oxidoreductase [Actinobacteria bacterium]|nr:SDR family NAD(P)-dependent oxidoreductase [Actinomycetota bacterium]
MDLGGKVALVSGAGGGIGRATAVTLADLGAAVVAVDIDASSAARTVEDIGRAGGRALRHVCDVTRPNDVATALGHAREEFGGLDVVCNIAGIGGDNRWLADEGSDWRQVIEVDLVAVIDATRQAIRAMTGRGGAIINMSSLIALYPMAAAPIYGAAKAGVVTFTRSLTSLAVEKSIRVNAICPELVDTDMAKPLGKEALAEARRTGSILTPQSIADLIVEIISDDSRAGEIVQITAGEGIQWVDLTPTPT